MPAWTGTPPRRCCETPTRCSASCCPRAGRSDSRGRTLEGATMLVNWVNRLRKRSALFGAVAALVLCTVASWLNPASDEYLSYGNGVSLPIGIPFHPDTPAQAAAYLRLLHVLYVVEPPLQGLTLVLLAGVLWSRVVRQERIVLALLLVPAFTAVLLLAEGAFQVIYPHLDD